MRAFLGLAPNAAKRGKNHIQHQQHPHTYMSAAAVAVNANANVTANSAELSELAKRIQIANRVQLTRRFCGQRDQVCVANNIIAIYGIACVAVIVSDHKYVCTLFTLIAFNAKTH